MRYILSLFALFLVSVMISGCSTYTKQQPTQMAQTKPPLPTDFSSRVPSELHTGEKTILIDPNTHAWGAYSANGDLIRSGLAVAGADWCPDLGRRCHTGSGSFRIQSLGSASCKSSIYPKPRGGAPMPYCMFFHGGYALHGSNFVPDYNASHGCVRMSPEDAQWLNEDFVQEGVTQVHVQY